MTGPFPTHRAAALALLNDPDLRMTRKAGSFLGQLAVDRAALTDLQMDWLQKLLARAGLPVFTDGGAGE